MSSQPGQVQGQYPQQAPYPPPPQTPAFAAPYHPAPKPPGSGISGLDLTAGLLLIVTSVAATVGSFLNWYRVTVQDGFAYSATNWTYKSGSPGQVVTRVTVSGGVLAAACAVALIAGVLLVAGLGRRMKPIRALGTAGAGLVVAAVATDLLSAVDTLRLADTTISKTSTLGPGFWVLLIAGLGALAALVLGVLSLRSPKVPAAWPTGAAVPQSAPAPYQYPYGQPVPIPAPVVQPGGPYAPPQQQLPVYYGQAEPAQAQQAAPQQHYPTQQVPTLPPTLLEQQAVPRPQPQSMPPAPPQPQPQPVADVQPTPGPTADVTPTLASTPIAASAAPPPTVPQATVPPPTLPQPTADASPTSAPTGLAPASEPPTLIADGPADATRALPDAEEPTVVEPPTVALPTSPTPPPTRPMPPSTPPPTLPTQPEPEEPAHEP